MTSKWGQQGRCPSCGSGQVVLQVFGMPAEDFDRPDWVELAGCIPIAGGSWSCRTCGSRFDR